MGKGFLKGSLLGIGGEVCGCANGTGAKKEGEQLDKKESYLIFALAASCRSGSWVAEGRGMLNIAPIL